MDRAFFLFIYENVYTKNTSEDLLMGALRTFVDDNDSWKIIFHLKLRTRKDSLKSLKLECIYNNFLSLSFRVNINNK